MTPDMEHAATALGLLRLVLTDQSDGARCLAGHLDGHEHETVADVLERMASAVNATILGLVHDTAGADLVRAAEAVAILLGLSAWLDGVSADQAEADVVGRVDQLIHRALGLEA